MNMTIIAMLIVEALAGEVTDETRRAVENLAQWGVPQPFGHLVHFVRGYRMDSEALTKDLVEEIRVICVEIQLEEVV